jgi:calcium-dependent protein kinase
LDNGEDDIHKYYTVRKRRLSQCPCGFEQQGRLKATGAFRAVKVIAKEQIQRRKSAFEKELDIMKMVDHPNVMMLYEIFEDEEHLYLVAAACSGGHLMNLVAKTGPLTEKQTAIVMQQVFRAVCYLHKHRVCHRNIKEENCLLESYKSIETCNVKVADFGRACNLAPNAHLKKMVGAPSHMAPEMLAKRYGLPCDMWSCGIVFFYLLSGDRPFYGNGDEEIRSKILNSTVQYRSPRWIDMSSSTLSFIDLLLLKSPSRRYSAEQSLIAPWILQNVPKCEGGCLCKDTLRRVTKFRALSKLKQAVIHSLVSMMPDSEIQIIHTACLHHDR